MKPERREAERVAYCRACDKAMTKGEEMISFYSWRNRGQNIHICLNCAQIIGNLAKQGTDDGLPQT